MEEEEGSVNLDTRGVYSPLSNRSADMDPNKGSRGKLSSDEKIAERLKMHALRCALSKPTIDDIIKHWWNKYQVSINPRSEREWATNHEAEILDLQQQMEKSGEIEVVHSSNGALTNTLAHGAKKKAVILEKSNRELGKAYDALTANRDVFAYLGIDKKKFLAMPEEEKKLARKDIDMVIKIRKMNIEEIKEFSSSSSAHAKDLKEFIALAKDINGTDAIMDKRLKDALAHDKQRRLVEKAGKENTVVIDPTQEITDADRES